MRGTYVLLITALAGCSSGVTTSSDVKLENATAHLMSSGTCPTSSGGALAPCATYQLTLSLRNEASRAIDRVEDVKLSTGGAPLQNQSAVGCAASPWTLPPGGESGVVTLLVTLGPQASLSIDCGDDVGIADGEEASTFLVAPPSAASSSFDLRIEGLLTDAQPFAATAHAPIL